MIRHGRECLGAGVAAIALIASLPACAQDAQRYDLPAQELGASVRAVVQRSGQSIIAPSELLVGKHAPALSGNFTPEGALSRLLEGSGLRVVRAGNALVIQRQSAESAQDADGGSVGAGDEAILVTGTRIRGHAPTGSTVIAIDRKTIDESGRATVQSLLQALPQNFGGGPGEQTLGVGRGNADLNGTYGAGINLRGLGVSSTLVLLNGERPPMAGVAGVFTDVSMIPLSAIERIEILGDGASALYGSDAVAGVVNIVPRDRFTGLEASARYGVADGTHEVQASAIGGLRWSGGQAVLSYEYYYRQNLSAADRPYYSEDLRRYGLGDFRGAPGLPGTIVAGGRNFAIPAGQNGTALTAGQLLADRTNVGDRYAMADLLPMQRRHAALLSVRQSVTDNLEIQAQALFGVRDFDGRAYVAFNGPSVTVPVTNPFYVDPIGTRQPVVVRYNFSREIGAEGTSGYSRAFGATANARLTLGAWQVQFGGTHGLQIEHFAVDNIVNSARLAAALADTNPATAFNVFGDGTANNPATIAKIRGQATGGGRYSMWSGQLRADGPLFTLPAGAVRLALGAEHRNEDFVGEPAVYDYATLTPVPAPTPALVANRRVTAGYAELLLPVSAAGSFPGRIEVSGAVRGEHYSDVGNTVNPKFGAVWEPLPRLAFRGTWGTSFRAPSFQDLRHDTSNTTYYTVALANPAAPGGVTNTLVIRGNAPGLGPERATSWTAGVDYGAGRSRGLHAQLTWFDIDYRDRIVSPASAITTIFTNSAVYAPIVDTSPDPAEIAAYFASPYFSRSSTIPASAITAIVDARTQNLSAQHMRGFDFDLGYRFALGGGSGEIGASGSYIASFRQKITATAAPLDVVDTIGNPPDLRVRGRASWSAGGFGAAAFLNYTDSYRNTSRTPVTRVASWTTLDLRLSYRIDGSGPFGGGLTLSLSANNLFDTDPPRTAYLLGSRTVGYDVENANPLGRVLSVQATTRW